LEHRAEICAQTMDPHSQADGPSKRPTAVQKNANPQHRASPDARMDLCISKLSIFLNDFYLFEKKLAEARYCDQELMYSLCPKINYLVLLRYENMIYFNV
jgi:hypothetical protein